MLAWYLALRSSWTATTDITSNSVIDKGEQQGWHNFSEGLKIFIAHHRVHENSVDWLQMLYQFYREKVPEFLLDCYGIILKTVTKLLHYNHK